MLNVVLFSKNGCFPEMCFVMFAIKLLKMPPKVTVGNAKDMPEVENNGQKFSYCVFCNFLNKLLKEVHQTFLDGHIFN